MKSEPKISCVLPSGGTTALLKYDADILSKDFCRLLQKKTGVALVPAEVFEMEGYLRAGFCAEDLEAALKLVSEFLSEFN